ncbi:hypothetical protein [Pseudofrankia sp. DC12]|uniref:hypothetical protein n=1 Tax=Pseudofrankia sp. DC12 TaxID=683315 RepID=UPI000695A3FB|nr:hypothetical protein [Pseudofrankia sp. DC12]
MRLYQKVVDTYGSDIDTSNQDAMIMISITVGFQASLAGITGDINPQTITATVKSMKETELPGGDGIKFRCNGKADPANAAVCLRGGLTTTLNDKGQPAAYQVLGNAAIPS